MENLPQIFDYQHKKIRTVIIDGGPWFVARDICNILSLQVSGAVRGKKTRNYEDGIDEDDYRDGVGVADPIGRTQKVLVVSEGGLYDLIFKSHKPEAKPFKRWVTHELIPTVRKTGAYITERADPAMLRQAANHNEALADVNILVQSLMPAYKEAGMTPQFQLLAVKQLYARAGMDIPVGDMKYDRQLFDPAAIAAKLGVLSTAGKPHGQAVSAIISRLGLSPDEKELVPYTRNGHSGTCYQYVAGVVDKVSAWLVENDYPASIESLTSNRKRVYAVTYKTEGVRV